MPEQAQAEAGTQMTEEELKHLRGFASMIEGVERDGADVDMPEGARTVSLRISDTLANQVTMAMRQAHGEIENLRATVKEQANALEGMKRQMDIAITPQIIIPGAKR